MAVKTNLDTDFTRSGKDSNEEQLKFVQETANNVEWDGVKFVPKPMTLSRLNLAKLRDDQTFRDSNVKVNYYTAVLNVAIETTQEVMKQDPSPETAGIAELKRRIESI